MQHLPALNAEETLFELQSEILGAHAEYRLKLNRSMGICRFVCLRNAVKVRPRSGGAKQGDR